LRSSQEDRKPLLLAARQGKEAMTIRTYIVSGYDRSQGDMWQGRVRAFTAEDALVQARLQCEMCTMGDGKPARDVKRVDPMEDEP
jgi:hypothetical protein